MEVENIDQKPGENKSGIELKENNIDGYEKLYREIYQKKQDDEN